MLASMVALAVGLLRGLPAEHAIAPLGILCIGASVIQSLGWFDKKAGV